MRSRAAKIFVVEDDPEIMSLIQAFLDRAGYIVAGQAGQGDDALLEIEKASPDLILMDITLAGELDGIETATLIASRFEIPVVFLTGLADEETLQRSHAAQAFGYLLKPFDQDDLRAGIDLALSKHRVESRLRRVDRWFSAAIHSISDAVIACDRSGRITFVNPVAEKLTGHPASAAVGHPLGSIFDLVDDGDTAGAGNPLGGSVAEDEQLQFEANLRMPRGEVRPIECSAAPMRGADGRIIGRVLAFRDVSERQHAERALRESREQLRALAGHLQSARETERCHIAREIHDEFGQLLTGLRMDLVWMEKRLGPAGEAVHRRMAAALELVDGMVKQVRRIASDLRPGVLDDLGLVAALEWQAREWQKRTGIFCRFEASSDHIALAPEQGIALFRIFQEALTNVARHAGAESVQASVSTGQGRLRLEITDDGQGLKTPAEDRPQTFGLLGMRERAAVAGGELSVTGQPGQGTTVRVEIPIPTEITN